VVLFSGFRPRAACCEKGPAGEPGGRSPWPWAMAGSPPRRRAWRLPARPRSILQHQRDTRARSSGRSATGQRGPFRVKRVVHRAGRQEVASPAGRPGIVKQPDLDAAAGNVLHYQPRHGARATGARIPPPYAPARDPGVASRAWPPECREALCLSVGRAAPSAAVMARGGQRPSAP
jgi:hypothetical protein